MERLLYPIPEARERLGDIGHSTFYELKSEGKIATVKIGRRTFVAHDELERYIATLKAEARGAAEAEAPPLSDPEPATGGRAAFLAARGGGHRG
jgi:hypothetical protein